MINLREWALPVYTIMMQMAAGSMVMLWLVYTQIVRRYDRAMADRVSHNLVMIIFFTVVAAAIGSHYHLSRPFFSILAVRNFKTSWLSREIVFTIAFAIAVGALWLMQRYDLGSFRLRLAMGWVAAALGIATVYCMSHVYLLPTQIAWNSLATPVAFFSAMFLLGSMAISALLLMNLYLEVLRGGASLELEKHVFIVERTLLAATAIAVTAAIIQLANYVVEIRSLSEGGTSARASLDLLLGLYRVLFGIRLGMLATGVAALAGIVLWQRMTERHLVRLLTPIYFAFLLVLVSEVMGRFLFYAIHVRIGI